MLRAWGGGSLDWTTVQMTAIHYFAVTKPLPMVSLFALLFVALLRRQFKRSGRAG